MARTAVASVMRARPIFLRPGVIVSSAAPSELLWAMAVACSDTRSFHTDNRGKPIRACRSKKARRQCRRADIQAFRPALHAERGLVELDLAFASDLVGDLLPGGGDGVGGFLRRLVLAVDALDQLVLGNRVVLEDAGDAR